MPVGSALSPWIYPAFFLAAIFWHWKLRPCTSLIHQHPEAMVWQKGVSISGSLQVYRSTGTPSSPHSSKNAVDHSSATWPWYPQFFGQAANPRLWISLNYMLQTKPTTISLSSDISSRKAPALPSLSLPFFEHMAPAEAEEYHHQEAHVLPFWAVTLVAYLAHWLILLLSPAYHCSPPWQRAYSGPDHSLVHSQPLQAESE